MEFSGIKTNTSNRKTLILGLVFFLVIISLFSLINISSTQGAGANNSSADYLDAESPTSNDSKKVDGGGGLGGKIVAALLSPLNLLARLLLSLSQTVFTWILDTQNIKTVLGSDVLYEMWTYIRDLLNMAFIMMLLWSAFCTIFQVESYNYKKVLWKIILMALLVNFSFPIARFIIDASNILMYSLIDTQKNIFTGQSLKGGISDPLLDLLSPKSPTATFAIASIVMIFMLAITLLAIGVLLLIRLIALAILLILSPIAFIGFILPGLSSYASDWWNNLMKYSFFGPIMVFGVIVTIKLMSGIGAELTRKAQMAAISNTEDATFLGSIVVLMVPLVLLWMVMGIAQKMSIAGASAVTSKAQGMIKAGLAAPGKYTWRGIKKGAEATGVPGGFKQKWTKFKKTGPLGSDARERREAEWAEKGPYSIKGAVNEHERKKANEKLDEWKKTGPPPKKELQDSLFETDKIKARAAALQLAESTGFDGKYGDYEQALKVMEGDQSAIDTLNEKTKKKGRDLILAHKVNTQKDDAGNSFKLQDELAKISSSDFGSINFKNLVENTTASGRGGTSALKEFFKDTDKDRKIQIGRNISKENKSFLKEYMFEEEQTEKQEAPQEKPKKKPGFLS